MSVEGHINVSVVDDPDEIRRCNSPKGKPFLRLTFADGTVKDITTNLAEMLGGAGAGTRKRYEDSLRRSH